MKTAFFEVSYPTVHDHEKGIVTEEKAKRIHDEGGVTKDGISLRYLREKGFDIDGDGDVDAADVMALTPEQIEYDCIKHDFWHPLYEQLPQIVATKMLDTAVNVGSHQAHKFAQKAANDCGASLVVDGDFGPKTLAAINSILPSTFVIAMAEEQTLFYKDLLKRKPGMEPCRAGWLARAAWPFDVERFS